MQSPDDYGLYLDVQMKGCMDGKDWEEKYKHMTMIFCLLLHGGDQLIVPEVYATWLSIGCQCRCYNCRLM